MHGYDLERGAPTLVPLNSGTLMPALLLGFEDEGSDYIPSDPRWAQVGSAIPRWLIHVEQQAGGYAMSYPTAIGALFRLSANAVQGRRDPSPLVRGFHLMAEPPQYSDLLREYPDLHRLCGTRGEAYSPLQLEIFDRVLARLFDLPKAASGLEAFVRFEAPDPMRYLGGWRPVTVSPGCDRLEDDTCHGTWSETDIFDVTKQELLLRLGHIFWRGPVLRLFLLGELRLSRR